MSKQLDLLNKVYDQFSKDFTGSFHSVLWELMINGTHADKIKVFTPTYQTGDKGYTLGLAIRDEPGYNPCPAFFKEGYQHKRCWGITEKLNKLVFSLTPKPAWEVVASTMVVKLKYIDEVL